MRIRLDSKHLLILVRFPGSDKECGEMLEQICTTIDVVEAQKPVRSVWFDDTMVVQVKTTQQFIDMFDSLEEIRTAA